MKNKTLFTGDSARLQAQDAETCEEYDNEMWEFGTVTYFHINSDEMIRVEPLYFSAEFPFPHKLQWS